MDITETGNDSVQFRHRENMDRGIYYEGDHLPSLPVCRDVPWSVRLVPSMPSPFRRVYGPERGIKQIYSHEITIYKRLMQTHQKIFLANIWRHLGKRVDQSNETLCKWNAWCEENTIPWLQTDKSKKKGRGQSCMSEAHLQLQPLRNGLWQEKQRRVVRKGKWAAFQFRTQTRTREQTFHM